MKKRSKKVRQIPFVEDLELLARKGAQEMIKVVLDAEIKEFLGRVRYERSNEFRGYRNGYCKTRKLAVGLGEVEIAQPRVRNTPTGEEKFHSKIIQSYQRTSMETKRLLTDLYLEGLSSGDFEPVFRNILGENAPLSPSSIIRLKGEWQKEYDEWKGRKLESVYAYIWVDGVYLKAGPEKEKTALLVVLGVNSNGEKELLNIEEGYRESKESWKEVLRNLKSRGLRDIKLLIGDGNLGIWSSLSEVYPDSKWQRCWNHKVLNVQDKLPKRLQKEAKIEISNIWHAPTKDECLKRSANYSNRLKLQGQQKAAESVMRDLEHFVTFYDFPREHWIHIRTSNPIESIFSGVRLRTNVAKRMRSQSTVLYLVFKIIERLSMNWRLIHSPELVEAVLLGKTFRDGVYQEKDVRLVA